MKIYVITEDYVNRYDNIFTNNIGCYKTYKGASDKLKELVENPTNKTCKDSEVIKRKLYVAKSTKDAEDSWGQVRYESGTLEYHIEVHELN